MCSSENVNTQASQLPPSCSHKAFNLVLPGRKIPQGKNKLFPFNGCSLFIAKSLDKLARSFFFVCVCWTIFAFTFLLMVKYFTHFEQVNRNNQRYICFAENKNVECK